MRTVSTRGPSFPEARTETHLPPVPNQVWQVMCGDTDHWRVGVYSPAIGSREQVQELEQHDCPELFVLVRGRMTLVVAEGNQVREIELRQGEPVLIVAPHWGFCPDGPHSGEALVVERDSFDTEYRKVEEWIR